MSEIEQLQHAIEALESQRAVLGDAVVDTAVSPLRDKLRALRPEPADEQRKLVTILFADLVDFTAMAERMDPEDVREVVNAYFNLWTDSLSRFGGQVEKFIGDAVMAVFGLHISQEDDPENAVRAALEMRQSLEALNVRIEQTYHIRLTMRVGVHIGLVVVSFLGERKGQDFVVVGDSVNLASRLQAAAPPGGILISHDTYRHVRGIFDLESLPPLKVKGKQAAFKVYQVLRVRPRAFRLGTRGVEGVETRMIGREAELKRLQAIFASVHNGNSQFITLFGDVGVGKSRLLHEVDTWLEALPQNVYYFKGRAHPSTQNLPYALIRDVFAFRFQIYESDTPEQIRQKMETGISLAIPNDPERAVRGAHIVANLLGYQIDPHTHLASGPDSARQLRDRALASIVEYFAVLSAQNPVVIMLEDLQWADDSSLDVIEHLASESAELRLLIICAARPTLLENRPGWGQRSNAQRIDLQPLSKAESRRLVAEILRKVRDLPASLRDLLVDQSEGNPFHMEELVKMLLEDGVILKKSGSWQVELDRLHAIEVPSTLAGVLQARFDSLSPHTRLLLQYASVVGRTFWDEAVAFIESPHENETGFGARSSGAEARRSAWELLVSRDIIQRSREPVFAATTEYQFKHAVMRDVIYESVLKRERRIFHARAATWLEQVSQRVQRGEYAALIADHYERAGEIEAARDWYASAGEHAASRYAHREAVRCLSRALELTDSDALPERFRLVLLRESMLSLPGNRDEQKRDLAILEELADRIGDNASRAEALLRRVQLHNVTGDLETAAADAARAVNMAKSAGKLGLEALACLSLGNALWRKGDFVGARLPLEEALQLALQAGNERVEADALRSLGVLAEADNDNIGSREYFERALALILKLGDRRAESMIYNSLGILAYNQCNFTGAKKLLSQSLKIKREIGDRFGENITLNNLGLLEFKRGEYSTAYRYFEQVVRLSRVIQDEEGEALASGTMAAILVFIGDYQQAREPLEKSAETLSTIGDFQAECEALSILSILRLYTGDPQAAFGIAQQAVSLAPDHGTHMERVRSAYSLGEAALALGLIEKAVSIYSDLLAIEWDEGQENQHIEIVACLARALFINGDHAAAAALNEDVIFYIEGEGRSMIEGTDHPFRAYLTCFEIMQSQGDARAGRILNSAVRLLQSQAEKLGSEHWRRCFLENVPHHRQLLEEWENLNSPRVMPESFTPDQKTGL